MFRQATAVLARPDQSENAKAYFRRATAYYYLDEMDAAKEDIVTAVKLLPKDKSIRTLYNKVVERIKALREREKRAFGGFFGKVDIYDDKEQVEVFQPTLPRPRVFFDIKSDGEDCKSQYCS